MVSLRLTYKRIFPRWRYVRLLSSLSLTSDVALNSTIETLSEKCQNKSESGLVGLYKRWIALELTSLCTRLKVSTASDN